MSKTVYRGYRATDKPQVLRGNGVNGKVMSSPNYRIGSEGYPRINGVRIHRIVACLDNNPERVFSNPGTEVHHKNGIPWDNRPENIELLSRSEHRMAHWGERFEERPFHNEDVLNRLYHDEGMSSIEIAEKYDVSPPAIRYWMEKNGVETRETGHEALSEYDVESMYHNEGLSQSKIAEKVGVARRQVYEYMKSESIETRPPGNPNPPSGEDHVQHVSKEQMIRDIQQVREKIGKWPTTMEYREHGKHSIASVYGKFGSIGDFREKARKEEP